MAIAEKLGQIRDDVNSIKTVLGVPQNTSLADTVSAIEGVNNALESMTDATAAGDFISVEEYFETRPSSVPSGTYDSHPIENYIKKCPDIIIPSTNARFLDYFASRYSFKKAPKIIFGENIQSCQYLFSNAVIESVDVSGFDLKNVFSVANMFYTCKNLKTFDGSMWESNQSIRMNSMFSYCSSLVSVVFGTYKVYSVGYMFQSDTGLKSIDMSNLDFSTIVGNTDSSSYNWFIGCSALEDIVFGSNFGKGIAQTAHTLSAGIDLTDSPLLTHDSLMSIINNVYDISGHPAQVLKFGTVNLEKLTAEEIAIATNKGWTVL